jgi:hypothetical protein
MRRAEARSEDMQHILALIVMAIVDQDGPIRFVSNLWKSRRVTPAISTALANVTRFCWKRVL